MKARRSGAPGPGSASPSAKLRKAVLFTGYSCNNRCGFCVDYEKRHIPDKTTATLIREMARAKAWGADYLELIGGEASLRADFLKLVRSAKKIGFRDIATATNGRLFAYPDFARAALRAGLTSIIFSVHGHTAALHDRLTAAAGSFAQLCDGVRSLRALGFKRLHANATVVRQNYRFLPRLGELFLRLGFCGVELIFVDPTYGGAHRSFSKFVPRISLAAPWMRRCLDIGRAAGTRSWFVRYVPLCHFQGYEDQVSETMERRTFAATLHWAPDFKNEDVAGSRAAVARAKPGSCGGCRLSGECEGIWREYLRVYGAAELRPVL